VVAGLFVMAAALDGCNVGETNQPLTIVDESPPSTTGGAGSGAASPSGAVGGATCWASQLPPEPQAPEPQLSVAEACQRSASATSWSFPTPSQSMAPTRNDDHDRDIVGRWVPCGAATLVPQAHAGVEFAGNGRWRLLGKDATGALVPMATAGYYYLLTGGQLNLEGEAPPGSWGGNNVVAFADGSRDVVRFSAGGEAYARVAPSASNGDDNAPAVSDGHCSMLGSWDVPANDATPQAPASRWSFDASGRFVVDSPSDDLCGPHNQWGTYQLAKGFFELTQNWNLGLCDWWFTADYPYKFSDDCKILTLTQQWDNCTGGRGYLNGMTKLTRRP
jgi:hypothetical protein